MKLLFSSLLFLGFFLSSNAQNECDPVWVEYGTYKNDDQIALEALAEPMELNVKGENCDWKFEIIHYEVSINNEVIGENTSGEMPPKVLKKLKKADSQDAIIFSEIEVKVLDFNKTTTLSAIRIFVQ